MKPCAVWFFAPHESSNLTIWTKRMREATDNRTKIWIQVGSVAEALEIAETCNPDVLVIQGADAGGHGLVRNAGLISLLPECADALQDAGYGKIPLIAAGGIADSRGVVAASILGASGACLGTSFLASHEAEIVEG